MAAKDQTISRAPGRRWLIPVAFVWAVGALLWFLADGFLLQSAQSQVIVLATMLTALGLIGAAAMSRGMEVWTALARLKLGPWMAIGFSLGFGLATLTWLGDTQSNSGYYHGAVTPSSLVPAATVAGAGFLALVVAYRLTPCLLREWGCKVDRRLRGDGALSPGAVSVWTLWGVAVSAQAFFFARGSLGYLSDPAAG